MQLVHYLQITAVIILILALTPVERVASLIPSNWAVTNFGLWDVYIPRGTFNVLVPPGEKILNEAKSIHVLTAQLARRRFFRIFRADLDRECPFWARHDLCRSPTGGCNICTCDQDEIPPRWISKPRESFVNHDADVSVWETGYNRGFLAGSAGEAEQKFLNELTGLQDNYVDLQKNLPGFTNYKGRNIWELIYNENCFGDDQCTEAQCFKKLVSGLQTCVMVIASEYSAEGDALRSLLNRIIPFSTLRTIKADGTAYKFNLALYRFRANNPEWVNNLFFTVSILQRSMAKLSGIIDNCPCYTGMPSEDLESRELLTKMMSYIKQSASAQMTPHIFGSQQDRSIEKISNISRIFDCIECEKCRLHGKVKLAALQVAIKTLGPEEWQQVHDLERNEVSGLINAMNYFTDSLRIVSVMYWRVMFRRFVFYALISTSTTYLLSKLVGCPYLYAKRLWGTEQRSAPAAHTK